MSEHKNGEGGRTMKREKRKVALSSVQEEKKEKKESVSRSLWRRKEREKGGGQMLHVEPVSSPQRKIRPNIPSKNQFTNRRHPCHRTTQTSLARATGSHRKNEHN